MKKKVIIIHTSFVSVDYLGSLFKEIVPEIDVQNIVDDSLLAEIMANGGVTPAVIKRYCNYAWHAESIGADLIFNQCSSASPAADIAALTVKIPLLKVDLPMAEEAVAIGSRISVIATVQSTLGPSVKLIESVASSCGRSVQVTPYLVEGALDILMKTKNKALHNQMVMEKVNSISSHSDVIVFAQGSMVALLDDVKNVPIPVLTSPRSGVSRVRKILNLA